MIKFLNLFEDRYKGPITNLFLNPIREGITDNEKIIVYVMAGLHKRRFRKEWKDGRCTGKVTRVELPDHLKVVEDNLRNPDIIPFIEYYKKYSTLDRDHRKVVKSRKATQKRNLKDFINSNRPLSWSAIYSFRYDPMQFFDKYILGKKPESNIKMDFGKEIGERLVKDSLFLPDVLRYPVFEQKLTGKISDIPIIGYLDSFNPETKDFYEYKTSSNKNRWTQQTAQEHGQLLFYKLLIYLNYKVKEPKCSLFYIPCNTKGTFGEQMELTKDAPIQRFDVQHSFSDIVNFAKEIKDTYNEMQSFINKKV